MFVIPLLWCTIALSATLLLGAPQDAALLVAAVALVHLARAPADEHAAGVPQDELRTTKRDCRVLRLPDEDPVTTLKGGAPVLALPAAPADPAGLARAVDALRAAWGSVPDFAPHVDLALERLDLLGEGGMGVVWRVRDRRLGRLAALKLMRDGVRRGALPA